jgi:hypothetical protein
MRAQLHITDNSEPFNLELPEAQLFEASRIRLSVHSHIFATEWRAHLGYNERGEEVTRSIFSTVPDPGKSLRDLYALCV